jgi:hypothetical protein
MKGDQANRDTASRRERLASALRENLKRRKAQARGRAQSDDPMQAPETGAPSEPPPKRGKEDT